MLAPPRGLSQRATSFIASRRQGIHQMPLRRLSSARRHNTSPPYTGAPPQPSYPVAQSLGRPVTRSRQTHPTAKPHATPATHIPPVTPLDQIPIPVPEPESPNPATGPDTPGPPQQRLFTLSNSLARISPPGASRPHDTKAPSPHGPAPSRLSLVFRTPEMIRSPRSTNALLV